MKSKLKVLIPIIIVLIIFLVGLFIVVRNTNDIELKEDKFIYEFGEDIKSDVSVYLKDADSTKNINNYVLTSNSLSIDEDKFIKSGSDIVPVGVYEIGVKYKDKSKKFVIEVLDTIAPEFTSSIELIEIEETSDDVDLTAYFEATDLSSVKLVVDGEYDLSKAGEYNLTIIAEDESNNRNEKDFILKVKERVKEEIKNTSSSPISSSNKSKVNTSVSNTQSTNNSSPSESYSGYRKDISNSYVSQVNVYRRANGLSELPVTAETQAEADRRSKELATYYSHDGVGYGFGEVIGNGTAGGDFITAWKKSPPHNATLLREQNTAIAASVYEVNGYWYTVISFKMDY